MEVRTIFFNGPKGHRWVTTVAPTDEEGNHECLHPDPSGGYLYKESYPDDRTVDRRRFFGSLNAMRARLERHGVSVDDMRRCYAKRFAVEGMSGCSQREWAIAAAEVQAMFRSPEVFSERIAWLKAQTLGHRPEDRCSLRNGTGA